MSRVWARSRPSGLVETAHKVITRLLRRDARANNARLSAFRHKFCHQVTDPSLLVNAPLLEEESYTVASTVLRYRRNPFLPPGSSLYSAGLSSFRGANSLFFFGSKLCPTYCWRRLRSRPRGSRHAHPPRRQNAGATNFSGITPQVAYDVAVFGSGLPIPGVVGFAALWGCLDNSPRTGANAISCSWFWSGPPPIQCIDIFSCREQSIGHHPS